MTTPSLLRIDRFGLTHLLGQRVVTGMALAVPVGVLIGLLEFLLGAAFFNFLAAYNLVPKTDVPGMIGTVLARINPAIGVIVIAAVVAVFRFISQFLPSIATEIFQTRIRQALTDRILGGVREATTLSVADVSAILTNLSPRTANMVNSASALLANAFFIATILISLLILSWQLTLGCIGGSLFVCLPLIFERKSRHRLSDISSHNLGVFTERIIKDVRNIHFLKVSGVNEVEQLAMTGVITRIIDSYTSWLVRYQIASNVPAFIGVVFAVMLVGANHHFGFVPLTILVPFVYLLSRLAGAIGQLLTVIANIEHVWPHVQCFMPYVPELFPPNVTIPDTFSEKELAVINRLDVENLSVGRQTSLANSINFSLGRGETFLISGSSGKGKTTLLMTLIGLIPPLDGNIRWNGHSIDAINPALFRSKVGYAGPDPYLFDGTIKQNLLFGAGEQPNDLTAIRKALWCAAADFVNDFPEGIDHPLHESGSGISAGQQQRLSIARALLRQPSILLLDEGTANIDEDTEHLIMGRIRQTFPNIMIIAISHRSSMRHFANSIYEM